MTLRATSYIPMVSLILWTGCIHWAPPEPLLHNTPVERSCDGSTVLTEGAIHLSSRDISSVPLRKGAHTMIDMAYGVDAEDQSYYNDTLISSAQHHQQDCKLDLSTVETTPIGGTIRDQWNVTPLHDALATIDTGIGLHWQWNDSQGSIRYAPSYDSETFQPYVIFGPTGKEGTAGRHPEDGGRAYSGDKGANGGSGKSGSPGSNGQDAWLPGQSGGHGGDGGRGGDGMNGGKGKDATTASGNGTNGGHGSPGGNGSHGADGGNGYPGNHAEMGEDGQRGVDGPELNITIKPIYSRFYPGETLVYVEVLSSLNGNTHTENYIFHQGNPFTFTTQGGQGGDGGNGGQGGHGGEGGRGGDGGRGGHGGDGGNGGDGGSGDTTQGIAAGKDGKGGNGSRGGNGGNGGDGGHGAPGGCGGDGGDGAPGGNGGNISVQVYGNISFRERALSAFRFQSIGGNGGDGGQGGSLGYTGSGGRTGYAGLGGNGGSAGSGSQYGNSGSGGSSGISGRSGGQIGQRYCDTDNGYNGPTGYSGQIQIQQIAMETP